MLGAFEVDHMAHFAISSQIVPEQLGWPRTPFSARQVLAKHSLGTAIRMSIERHHLLFALAPNFDFSFENLTDSA